MSSPTPAADDLPADVGAIIERAEPRRAQQARQVVQWITDAAGVQPMAWGSIIGFGKRPYTTADGKQHDHFAVGLVPRKTALVLYGLTEDGRSDDLLEGLGPHSRGKGCLYLKQPDAVDVAVFRQMVRRAMDAS